MDSALYINVLGRLLVSGVHRDAFAQDPEGTLRELGADEPVTAAMRTIPPRRLEEQAVVLLRKRWVLVAPALPELCERLGEGKAWELFREEARGVWRTHDRDTRLFLASAMERLPSSFATEADWNRWQFLVEGGILRFHLIHAEGRWFPWLQVLSRNRNGCSEMRLGFGAEPQH
ncbi:MAG: hypothetical protein ACAI35_26285 [Candidatus Methylacidiphilales bacterium]|nr:hypothetical protein [Candidatus Methylacidiphilales bacterium]